MFLPDSREPGAGHEELFAELQGTHPSVSVDAKVDRSLWKRGGLTPASHLPTQGDKSDASNHRERAERERLDERNREKKRGEAEPGLAKHGKHVAQSDAIAAGVVDAVLQCGFYGGLVHAKIDGGRPVTARLG